MKSGKMPDSHSRVLASSPPVFVNRLSPIIDAHYKRKMGMVDFIFLNLANPSLYKITLGHISVSFSSMTSKNLLACNLFLVPTNMMQSIHS